MRNRTTPRVAIVVPLVLLAACADASPGVAGVSRTTTLAFIIDMQAAPVRTGYSTQQFELRVQPYYARTAGGPSSIGAMVAVPLGTVSSLRAPVNIVLDPSGCAGDPLRTPAGDGCPVRVDIKLFLVNGGLVLDHQKIGPWLVKESRLSLSDTVRITDVGVPDVLPLSPTIPVGSSVQMSARFVTVRGDTVSRPVVWRSEAPGIAVVDTSGVVTGLAAGSAGIVAIFGEGQSSNGQVVTVRAP